MVRINKLQREFLEEIGIIKPSNKKWYFNGMSIANRQSNSKGKSYYVEDSFIAYIDPEWFSSISSKYQEKKYIDNQIKFAQEYLEKYNKSK